MKVTQSHLEITRRIAFDFLNNNIKVLEMDDEIALQIYLKNGKVFSSAIQFGEGSEVNLDEVPGKLLAVIHNHPDGNTEPSSDDEDFANEVIEETKGPFYLFIIGRDDENELTMQEHEFMSE